MRFLLVLLLAAPGEPEPGPVPARAVLLRELQIPARPGDAQAALRTFIEAHVQHKNGRIDQALLGYLKFLGMPGRKHLPPRYLATVQRRFDKLQESVKVEHDKAVELYTKDRARGLAALQAVAERYAPLPTGVAAKKLWHTDRLFEAITAARAAKDKGAAAAELEKAIKSWPAAVYLYEAKSLLLELGGPDLFEKGERVGDDDD